MIKVEELIKFRENNMNLYKQKDNISDREKQIEGDLFNDKYCGLFVRNEFSRDADRIKFSRAFRRMEHKAQVYTYTKGDHFRTRLTHSLEVAQISRSLARNLNLNEDLVEAIALGHDIGHTPFGHQGERTLDKIMSGQDDLTGKLKYKINYGGFKHNFHSVKILDKIEVKYKYIQGINLTWQVLEGILKHTKTKRAEGEIGWDISRFTENEKVNEFFELPFSVTLEGQVVAISDEIAQREHDIDDGLRDDDLKLSFNEVINYFKDEFNKLYISYQKEKNIFSENLRDLLNYIEELSIREKEYNSKESLYEKNSLVGKFIDFFIKDVTFNSLSKLINISSEEFDENKNIFRNKIIDFSYIGERVNKIIEDYINLQVLNSYNVNRFDGKSIYIIRQLFKAYYTNPRQMPKYILKRLTDKVSSICNELYEINIQSSKNKKFTSVKTINFDRSRGDEVEKLLKVMKLELRVNEICHSKDFIKELEEKEYIDRETYLIKAKVYEEISIRNELISESDKFIKSLLEIHYVYLSTICDYIAGMTDNYASDEFKNLYLVDSN